MGGGSWDSGSYADAAKTRSTTGVADFQYDRDVKSGKASGIHALLDPTRVAGAKSPLAGQNIWESRDIAGEHENSLPVAVFFDVTGSMHEIPRRMQKKLASLMDVIIAKAGINDSQILVGAIGDSTCDRYPFQVGQFESDNRFDETLRAIICEGNGGGQIQESYALAYYFAAFKTATDSWEKRGKKGYLFTMGDENPWPTVPRSHAEKIFGVASSEKDETVEDLLALALERWEIYHIIPTKGSSHGNDPKVQGRWRDLLGERVCLIEDADLACETIAALVHGLESAKGIDAIDDVGLDAHGASVVRNALVPIFKNVVPSATASGSVPDAGAAAGGISRI